MSLISRTLAATSLLAAVLAAPSARATGTGEASPAAASPDDDVKAACVADLDRAQSLQGEHRLRDARASYVSCAREACPGVLREDCARSLVALDAAMPTVVFSAQADGADVLDVRVRLDGDLVTERLDGRAFTVDPGPHVARFERAGRSPLDVKLVAREGEKNRLVSAAFTTPHPAIPWKPVRAEGSHGLPVLPVLLAGTGLLAVGGGLFMRFRADADADSLHSSCAPSCDPAARDALSNELVVANVALAVGVTALAASAVTWIVDSSRHHR